MMIKCKSKLKTVPLHQLDVVIFQGVSPSRIYETNNSKNQISLINIKNISDGQIHLDETDYILTDYHRNLDKYVIRPEDVIITCRGTLLKSAVVPEQLDGCLISSNLIAIRLNGNFEPELLVAYLQSPAGQKALLANVRSSTMQLALNVSDIEKIELPLIPKNEQKKLAGLIASANQYYQAAVECASLRREIAHSIALNVFTQGVSNE